MIRKRSAVLFFLLLACVITPIDNHFFGGILQPDRAIAQRAFVLEDFALYSQTEVKLDNMGESRGIVGSSGDISIKKGAAGSVIGSLQASGDIKNEAEIGIYGDVTARIIEDIGSIFASGQKIEGADLVPFVLPTLSFSSAGSDLEIPESISMTIAPGSYGRLKVKKGATFSDTIHLAKGARFRHYAAKMNGRPPTADAGGYQTALAGGQVTLDGSGSSDPDGDTITYHWSFVSFPDGSSPALSDPTDQMPTFTADMVGVYVIELSVDDGRYASLRDTVTVTAVSQVLGVTDFVLYADDKIKMDEISGGVVHVGTNRHIRIDKGPSGTITGDLRVLGHIKNGGEIRIIGDVITNSIMDNHGIFIVTGMKIENAALTPRMIPPLSFSAEGADLNVPEFASQVLVPESYGRVKVKNGGALQFTTGSYFLRELKTDDSAILIFDVTGGRVELNIVEKLEFGRDAVLQITGGGSRDVLINYAGKKEVEIEDRSVFRGTLVAPRAKVGFEKDSRLKGAVYARKIDLDQGVSFQFHEPAAKNNPPVANSQTNTTAEDTPTTIALSGSDPDGDSLTFTINSQPAHGTLAGTAPDLTYTPGENYNGADVFSFMVNDGSMDSDPATVNISVAAVNDAPVAEAQTISLNEDESKPVVLSGFDVEGDTLAYEIVGQPSNGTLSGTAPDLTYTPGENYHGDDSFSFRVNDGNLSGNTAMVSLTIISVNDAPVAKAGSDQTVFKGDTISLNGSDSGDVDGDTLSFQWSLSSGPAGSTAALSDSSVINPGFVPDIVGTYTVQLIVNDGTVNSTPDIVVITADPRMVSVPDVVGQVQADAMADLVGANLTVGTISTAYNETIPADHVISQIPAAGVSIVEGSAADLVVSLGPENQTPTADISASSATIAQGESVLLSWSSTFTQSAHIDNGIGTVNPTGSLSVSPEHTITYTLTVSGPAGSASSQVTVMVLGAPEPQPEGYFGEQYEDLIPPDATVDSYDPKRFSLITGLIQDLSASPIADVSISIHSHPEYGTVTSDTEGRFSFPVEGGATITVVYQKPGLISAHRKVDVPWNDIAIAETIQMITEDPVSTTLTFDGNPDTVVTHQSSVITDEFGSRSASMVLTGDNRAYLVDENGNDVQELTTITTRATEYTTPKSMPAKLPPNSAYTYCVELSVDGAQRVRFDKPVIAWIDNFLGFDVGMAVPVGYYDRDKGLWVPAENGVVVKLLDTDFDGIADALDANGDDQPDDLNNNGSFSDEVLGLEASVRYSPGLTFWRVAVSHFTPWDCNWPYGPPLDSIPPNPLGPSLADQQQVEPLTCPIPSNSYVEARSRVYHEDIPIPGTDITLHYAANRVKGYQHLITVPASGETVPGSLKNIIVSLDITGRSFKNILDPLPEQMSEFIWDGLDHLGRRVSGSVIADVKIGFVYDAVYLRPGAFNRAFAQAGNQVTGIRARRETISWKTGTITLPVQTTVGLDAIAEGWTLSSYHHVYRADPSTLHKGDGTTEAVNNLNIITTIAGDGSPGYSGDGEPAIDAQLRWPLGIAFDSLGNLYITDASNNRIRKVDVNGNITTVAGNGGSGFSGDGGLATNARLRGPYSVSVDSTGNLYIAEYANNRIRKVDTSGIITTVAGNGVRGYGGDGGPATNAKLYYPRGTAVDSTGNLYIADNYNHCIRKVDTGGIITTVAGNGTRTRGYSGDRGPATNAQLQYPRGVTLDSKGNLYIADTSNDCIRKVDIAGIITTVAGKGGRYGYSGDGGPATNARLNSPTDLAFDSSDNLYIFDTRNFCIRKVDTNGIITTVAGNGTQGYGGDGGLAIDAQLDLSGGKGIAADSMGNIYFSDSYNNRIRKVAPPEMFAGSMSFGEMLFIEDTGIGHIMDSSGRHKNSVEIDTSITLLEYNHDLDNNLISITDRFGNQTTIARDGYGVPTSITSPDGLTTTLAIDSNNHLTQITYPDGSYYGFEYTPEGLMTAENEPEGNRFEHVFDALGRLADVTDQEEGHWNHSRDAYPTGEIRTEILTGEGNLTTYLDHTYLTGVYTSTITDPTGAETMYSQSADGLTVDKYLPCGIQLESKYDIDPEYKYKYVKEMKQRAPSGLEMVTAKNKTYEDTDFDDIPDLITETLTINGKTTTLAHYTLQAQKVVTSPEGRTVTSLYNQYNLLTESVTVPGLFDTDYGYDSRGRLKSITTNTRQSTFTHSPEGFLESVTDPENHTTTYSYDTVGRITGINRPDGGSVGFTYDKNGNMTVLTNPVDVDHGFGFNTVNRNSSYQTPLSGGYSYIYDRDRRLIQTNFPSGNSIINDYTDPDNPDDKSRLWQIRTPEGNIDFTYLCGTKVESITKYAESITYGYDGKLVTAETLAGTLNQSLAYTYNNDFDISSFTYAGGTVNYSNDNDGLLTGAGNFTIARNADNGLPESVSGGTFSLSRTFNGYGEVEGKIFTVGGQNAISWALTRDNNGRIISKTETVGGVTSNITYTYDSMGRLLTVTKDGNLVEEYGYDLSGTRVFETNTLRGITGRTFSYSDEDHLLAADSISYASDLDGFLTTKTDGGDVTTYSYSTRGELLNVVLPDGTVVEYVHDPFGRRIAKEVDGAITEKYLWQGLTRLLAVYDGSDNLLMRFEYADSRMPVAMTSGGSTYYLTYDQVGSLKLVADSVGNVIKSLTYDSFGNIINDSNPTFKLPFGFAGGLYDRDTGLVRFGYRDYDPDVGRWTAKDPIGFAGGDTDLYGYVLNDPINLIDPYGLFWSEFAHGFNKHIIEKAWETGKTPGIFEASAAGLAEWIRSWSDPYYDKEFEIWRPWPVEYFLEPYLEDKWLENKGDFPDIAADPCA